MGTQKNRLNEHPKHIIKLMVKKIFTILCSKILVILQEKLQKLVLWMGGLTMKAFTEDVTHLVAGVVGSKKYLVRPCLKIFEYPQHMS